MSSRCNYDCYTKHRYMLYERLCNAVAKLVMRHGIGDGNKVCSVVRAWQILVVYKLQVKYGV